MEIADLYIKSIVYENVSWIDNPDDLLDLLNNNFSDISQFYYGSLSLRMAQVYNVNLKESDYESMILYIKRIRYKGEYFLSKDNIIELKEKIVEQLNYVDELYFGNIEIRSSKLYSDKSLGL